MRLEISLDPAVLDLLDHQTAILIALEEKVDGLMAMLTDLIAKVAQEKTDIGSLTVFIQGLEDKITAIPGMTPAIQSQIDALFANVDANDKAIVAAMKIGVPPAPAPTVVPPVV